MTITNKQQRANLIRFFLVCLENERLRKLTFYSSFESKKSSDFSKLLIFCVEHVYNDAVSQKEEMGKLVEEMHDLVLSSRMVAQNQNQ